MKPLLGLVLLLCSLSALAGDKSRCDSLLNQALAVSGAFENVAHLDSLLEVDRQRLATCGSWDATDQQIMNTGYLKEIVSAALKDNGEFPTYADVLAIFEHVKKTDLYPAIRLSKQTFELLAGKVVDWDSLEYDKIRTILITEEEFNSFKEFLGSNKFAGELNYSELLEQYYATAQ